MAESITKDFKGNADWVYVGKSEAPKPVEQRANTLFNEYMQKVFDVAAPVALKEIGEAGATQGMMAAETAQLIIPKELQGTIPDKGTFTEKWLSWEKKASTPEHQNRLGKLLTGMVYMGGSFLLNFGGEQLASALYRDRKSMPFISKPISLSDASGNKRMLDAGWEYLTDFGIEKTVDWSVKKLTNNEQVGFVSPLSRTIGKIGNTIMNVSPDFGKHDVKSLIKKSVLNPGFIEGAFRFAGALPGGGFIKEFYGKANSQIMKGEGLIPVGADLAFNMIFAKMANPSREMIKPTKKK